MDLLFAPVDMVMSQNGSIIVITYGNAKDAEVYVKDETGFTYNQSLPSSLGAESATIGANSIVLNTGTTDIRYYAMVAGNYQVTYTETEPYPISGI